jgi:hypothetical protein
VGSLPPGYSLVAGIVIKAPPEGMEAVRTQQRAEELKQVEAKLNDLQQAQRIGVGGPVLAMIVGYGTAVASSFVALAAFESARDRRHDSNPARHDEETRFRRLGYGFSAAAGAGLLTGILGSTALSRRIEQRKDRASERADLAGRLSTLRQQLDYGLSVAPQQVQVAVQSSF